MKITKPKCPTCRKYARGSCDLIPGVALFGDFKKGGIVEYAGETDVMWDNQFGDAPKGKVRLVCDGGHEWLSNVKQDD